MKTILGFFESMAQVRKSIEELRGAGFESAPTTAISAATNSAANPPASEPEPYASPETSDPTAIGGAYNTGASLAGASLTLPITDTAPTPNTENDEAATERAARSATNDPGLSSIPGGLRGALAKWGFSNELIRDCEQQIAAGRALLTVELTDESAAGRVRAVLLQQGAERVIDSGHVRV